MNSGNQEPQIEQEPQQDTNQESHKRSILLKILLGIFVATEDMPYSASEFVEEAQKSKQKIVIWISVSIFWLSLLSLIGLSYIFLNSKNTLFNVTATTEIVEIESFKIAKKHSKNGSKEKNDQMTAFPPWRLNDAKIYDSCDEDFDFLSGTLKINPTTLIEFRRVDTKELIISLVSEDSDSVGFINLNSGNKHLLSDCVGIELITNSNTSYTFPFDGKIFIGNDMKEDVSRSPILYNGTVGIADKAVLSQEYYSAEKYELAIGDKFSIRNQSTQSSGFIFVNNEPGMKITYRGKGVNGVISKYKSENVILKNSFWLKLYNDETILLLWLLLGAIYTATKVVTRFCIEHVDDNKNN